MPRIPRGRAFGRRGVSRLRLKPKMSLFVGWMLLGFLMPALASADENFVPSQNASKEEPTQGEPAEPTWWFGLAGAANLNFYGGTLQYLNSNVTAPVAFHKGFGAGPYLAPTLEYRPDPVWGGMLQVGYDDRRGDFFDVTCPCGEKASLSARPAYVSIE